jgi:hypothetical protein
MPNKPPKYHWDDTFNLRANPKPERPEGWSRKCQRCGRDPWPNYFYCSECLKRRTKQHCGGMKEVKTFWNTH